MLFCTLVHTELLHFFCCFFKLIAWHFFFFSPTPFKGQSNSSDFRADGQPCEFPSHSFLSYFCLLCLLSHSLFSGSSFFLLFSFPFFPFFTSLSLVPAFFPLLSCHHHPCLCHDPCTYLLRKLFINFT